MPFIRIGVWIVLLVSAMLLPFLPGRHDPLATTLAACATGISFARSVPIGLIVVPLAATAARMTLVKRFLFD